MRRNVRAAGGAFVLLLAACSSGASDAPPPDDDSRIACALASATAFARDCWVEQHRTGATLQLVVRHPDGAFRVFDVLTDGHGLATADGAQRASFVRAGTTLDVTVGADRYRFDAALLGNAP